MISGDRPALVPVPFAESGGKATIPDTTVDPGRASWTEGFPPETRQPISAGGIPPNGEDMNGVLYDIANWARWIGAGGPVAYDGTFATAIGGYPKGTVLSNSGFSGRWFSLVNSNTSNPDAGGTGWINMMPLVSTIAASATLTIKQQGMIPVDATSGNVTITLPSVFSALALPIQYQFVRVDGTANTVTITRVGSQTIEGVASISLPVGGRLALTGDGSTTWRIVSSVGRSGMQVFSSSGTFTVPAGVFNIFVRVWGAGGAGGTSSDGNYPGGGGGGGGYGEGIYAVTPGASISVTIGAGGVGGPGGSTSVGTLLTATGGNLGEAGSAGGIGGGATGGTVAGAPLGLIGNSGSNGIYYGSPGGTVEGGNGGAAFGGQPVRAVGTASLPLNGVQGSFPGGGGSGGTGGSGSGPGSGGAAVIMW